MATPSCNKQQMWADPYPTSALVLLALKTGLRSKKTHPGDLETYPKACCITTMQQTNFLCCSLPNPAKKYLCLALARLGRKEYGDICAFCFKKIPLPWGSEYECLQLHWCNLSPKLRSFAADTEELTQVQASCIHQRASCSLASVLNLVLKLKHVSERKPWPQMQNSGRWLVTHAR